MSKFRVICLLILIFGACANAKAPPPPGRNARLQVLQQQIDRISSKGDQCVNQATQRTDDQVKQLIAARNNPDSPEVRSVFDQGNSAIARCRQEEASAEAQFAALEQAEYIREAQEERDRAALMSTLTGSLGQ
jgi:hypothetical protein